MSLKNAIWIFLNLIFIFSFLVYWFYSTGPELSLNKIENTNFKINNSTSMQFYPNMRFPNKNITYSISDECNIKKKGDMEKAFEIMENKTILNFHKTNNDPEINIFCQDKQKTRGNLYIAGEGGPTEIINADFFKIIKGGEILLIRESHCKDPNIAIHELLHVLGFNHSENKNNIMYPISECSQELSKDIIEEINSIYSYESLPDLKISNLSIQTKGRYFDMNCTIINGGLSKAKNNSILIFLDEKKLKQIALEDVDIGEKLKIGLENIKLNKINFDQIKITIESSTNELSIENNKVILSESD